MTSNQADEQPNRVRANRVRVAIGMPVYNNVELVGQSIDSLLAQTYREFELIISDNASTDGTEQICRDYAARDPRIRYVRQEQNGGSAWNFNEVFRLADTEYFKWAAADDLCEPDFLQRCVELLDQHPSAAWSFTHSTHIDGAGRRMKGPKGEVLRFAQPPEGHDPIRGCTRSDQRPSDRFRAIVLDGRGCQDVYGLFRTSILRASQPMMPYFGSEKVLMAEVALRGGYVEAPELLFFGRIHEKACGSLQSSDAQKKFVNPLAGKKLQLTRLNLLRGYLKAIRHVPLPWNERRRCWNVVLRYLFQTHKWRQVIYRTLTGRGLAEDRSELLAATGDESSPKN